MSVSCCGWFCGRSSAKRPAGDCGEFMEDVCALSSFPSKLSWSHTPCFLPFSVRTRGGEGFWGGWKGWTWKVPQKPSIALNDCVNYYFFLSVVHCVCILKCLFFLFVKEKLNEGDEWNKAGWISQSCLGDLGSLFYLLMRKDKRMQKWNYSARWEGVFAGYVFLLTTWNVSDFESLVLSGVPRQFSNCSMW